MASGSGHLAPPAPAELHLPVFHSAHYFLPFYDAINTNTKMFYKKALTKHGFELEVGVGNKLCEKHDMALDNGIFLIWI